MVLLLMLSLMIDLCSLVNHSVSGRTIQHAACIAPTAETEGTEVWAL